MGARDLVTRLATRALIAALVVALIPGAASLLSPPGASAAIATEPVGNAGVQRVACVPVERVSAGDGSGLVWEAEPDLAPVARLLAAREGVFRPFPALPASTSETASEAAGPRTPIPGGPVRIVLVRDLACLSALGLSDPGVDWVAGLAILGERTVAVRVERAGASIPSVAAVLRHELAHVALHEASAGRAPRWLQEGYAQLESGTWDWAAAWRLRWAFLREGGQRLDRISLSFPSDPDGARMAYLLSYTAAQAIWQLSGERGFSAFVASLRDGSTVDEAFRSVFGITEGQFADRWQSGVASRYGLLYTLSRAGAFSALISVPLLWASLRRRRILRERMEALREADRRDPGAIDRGFVGPNPYPTIPPRFDDEPPAADIDASRGPI